MTHEVEVVRSARRKKTVNAQLVDGKIRVLIPARLSKKEEERIVAELVAKMEAKLSVSAKSDEQLAARAEQLNKRVLDSRATIGSIRWVTNQRRRWGSCSPLTNDIRISHLLQQVPDYVLDAVIVHELTHTFIHSGHSAEFWQWADRVPQAERAKGYLEAYSRFVGGSFDEA
ncbi:M48 metallopeptidase family protein [Corynebacterium epidermidicanis]|uniref:Putative metal-dependent hydrolase n=1 Tax=Corynebacterium epidermidicanis TaxID=1050174 RepID=A0A0G3GN33_9CORY|nr:SprT-like domain-containing protein [Corynebacterium epidermidicanis]AKK02564.1 putative metal-dependent hydrolase [Corynebacterium epidermidicanis]